MNVEKMNGEVRRKETNRKMKCSWTDNIKMDVGDRVWGGMDWKGLTQDRD
jgi:hypothetical protein